MSYPVAYRSPAARERAASGFQGAAPAGVAGAGFLAPATAKALEALARPPAPQPAPQPRGPKFGRAAVAKPGVAPAIARTSAARALAGLAGRIVLPGGLVLGAAYLAYELYQQYREYMDNLPVRPGSGSTMQSYGWSRVGCNPPKRPTDTGRIENAPGVNLCLTFQGDPGGVTDPGVPAIGAGNFIDRWKEWVDIGPSFRFDTIERWSRPAGTPTPAAMPGTRLRPHVWPGVIPALDPISMPIGTAPRAVPMPIPYSLLPARQPNPYRSPTEQSDWGNDAPAIGMPPLWWQAPDADVGPSVPAPIPVRMPDGTVGQVPIPDVVLSPSPSPVFRPPGHRFAPPSGRDRERKARVAGGALALVNRYLTNPITETGDVVDAIWDALPEKFRKREMAKRHGKPPNMITKMEQIYEHWDQVDLDEMVKNLVMNQLEDFAYGKFGQAQKKATQSAAERGFWRGMRGPATGSKNWMAKGIKL